MKQTFVRRLAGLALSFVFVMGCGGGPSGVDDKGNPIIPKSNLAKRVFVTNNFFGSVNIIDATNDNATVFTVVTATGAPPVFGGITDMQVNTGKTFLLDAGTNAIYAIDNSTEQLVQASIFGGPVASFVATQDSKLVYAAVPSLNSVQWVDITASSPVVTHIAVAGARRLIATQDNSKILVFGDDPDRVLVIKTSDNSSVSIPGFDRPYSAVISSDNTKAYILNCGRECGGTQAKVTILDLTNNTVGASLNVGGATVGVIDSNNLYVAGSPAVSTANTNGGTIDVIALSTFTRTGGAAISDGLHEDIAVASNSKVYVGSRGCTQINTATVTKGCLSFFNAGSNSATISAPLGDVTSIAPISGRSVVYTIQGGNLQIYNTSTDTLQTKQIDFNGKVVDVKEVK